MYNVYVYNHHNSSGMTLLFVRHVSVTYQPVFWFYFTKQVDWLEISGFGVLLTKSLVPVTSGGRQAWCVEIN